MSAFTLAICDDSPDYVSRFLTYVKSTRLLPFKVIGFTNPKPLEDYLSGGVVNILLLSGTFSTPDSFIHPEPFQGNNAKNINLIVRLGEQQNFENSTDCIYKYQSMRAICEKLLVIYRDLAGENEAFKTSGPEVYGVFSHFSSAERILLALSLSKARPDERTLFLDADPFAGFSALGASDEAGGFSDLIFSYRSDPSGLKNTLLNASFCAHETDIVFGLSDPADCREISSDEWPLFLKALSKEGGYSSIILGLSQVMFPPEDFMDLCSNVYVCSREGDLSLYDGNGILNSINNAVGAEMLRYFEKISRPDLQGRLIKTDMKQILSSWRS